MMEAIGQKAVLSSTDEVIISDELGVDSGEMGEERMFDVTLDEILAEHPLDESLLEGLLEEDSLTASLASSILTQNQANPESVRIFLVQQSCQPFQRKFWMTIFGLKKLILLD